MTDPLLEGSTEAAEPEKPIYAEGEEPVLVANPTGEIKVMGKSGDTPLQWDRSDRISTDIARGAFETFIQKGYRMYRMLPGSQRRTGEPVTSFDETAEKYLAVPPMQGG